MRLQELQNALGTGKTLYVRDGHVFIGPDSLNATFSPESLHPFCGEAGIAIEDAQGLSDGDPNKVAVKGRTSLPLLKLTEAAEVIATFELLDNEETLGVTLRYTLPPGWRFFQSFPDLPIPFDYASGRYDYESRQSALDASFSLTDCCFYLTTHEHDHRLDSDRQVSLAKGLNVQGRWAPRGMLGFVAHIVRGAAGTMVVRGQVVPRSTPALPVREDDELPWDASPRVPGIYLEVPLGSGPSFPSGSEAIKFTNLRVQTYTPLSRYWSLDDPSYQAETAYLGDLVIPSVRDTRLLTVSARVSPGQDDELVFACQFVDWNIENLLKASEAMAGGVNLHSLLPESIRNAIGQLGPQSASITLVRPNANSDYEAACTQLTIGMGKEAKPWSLFDGSLKVRFKSVRIAVATPFDSKRRLVSSTFRGTVEFFNIKLDLSVEAPVLYCSAEQIGTSTFDLQGYFERYKLRWPKFLPSKVHLANMRLQAQPDSYYSFSMSLGATYTLNDKYRLPTLSLAVSYHKPETRKPYLNWQFEGQTKQGDAVPVFVLIENLAGALGVGISLPAAVQDLISVHSVAVSYSSQWGDLAFVCWGTLRLNTVSLACGFTINHTPEKLGPPSTPSGTSFGGQILLAPDLGKPPLSFGLQFVQAGDSKCFLAAYSDEYGYPLKIKSLAECIFPKNFSNLIPDSLEISLKSAFVAYSQEKQPVTTATEPAGESATLFGVDLGAKIKLSDLPIVGNALPKDREIGFESLRVILASATFSEESVQKFNGLLPAGVVRLPDGPQRSDGTPGKLAGKNALDKGFSVSATLLFGNEPRTLTLPVMEESKETASVTGSASTSSRPTDQAAASPVVAAATRWFDIDKSLGPLTVRRIGLDYEAPRVGIKFDASLQLSVLTFNLEGLGLTYALGGSTEPLEILKNLAFTLDGMGLSLGNGPVEIGGSLVRVPRIDRQLELEGTLLIRTAPFTFSALGSYADVNGTISVMAFAVLLMELGDPTGTGAFVVTGLAFGFGVNRKLRLPPIEEVEKFPLIQAAMGKQDFQSLSKLPAKLSKYVSPAEGNFWIAAGIKFNSFVMVDSFLLVSVSWGAEVEIGLLGLSRMTVPPLQQDPDKVIAGAELALRGVIRIADGLIQFEARLTENSYIFSKACRLTGGFAFCLWFAGPHAGDFVVSLGGYHPAFARPAHYPLVPRLGMQLQIGRELSITGEAYFALTPSGIMAGGKLCAVFKSGGIEAWFIVYADFLMSWQPFYYQAAMGITLGIALRLGAIAIRLELSVDLRLQGPPFGGEARVRLWIISFTIPFGESASAPPPLKPREFVKNCLPAPKNPQEDKSPDVLSVRITSGLLREQKIDEHHSHRIVNAHQLCFVVQSVIPCTKFKGLAAKLKGAAPCGIRPMGETNLHSVFSVTAAGIEPDEHVKLSAVKGNVPDAVWGKSEKQGLVPRPKAPESKTIEATLGVRITCIPQEPLDGLTAIPIEELVFERIPTKIVDWALLERPKYDRPAETWTNYGAIWTDDAFGERRKQVLACLRQQLPRDWELYEPNLKELSENSDYFQAQPEMNAVGY